MKRQFDELFARDKDNARRRGTDEEYEAINESAASWFFLDFPRLIAEIERLRAGLDKIRTKQCHTEVFDGEDPIRCHDDGCGCSEEFSERLLSG